MTDEKDKEQGTRRSGSRSAGSSAHHTLDKEYIERGGVTAAEFAASDRVDLPSGQGEVSTLAMDAAGHTDGNRDIGDAERGQTALRIDSAARGYLSWLDSRPLNEQIAAANRPVIFAAAPDAEEG